MKIEEIQLEKKHIGTNVTYVPKHANGNCSHIACEHGQISSWNDRFVFVTYQTGTKATPPNLLVWG